MVPILTSVRLLPSYCHSWVSVPSKALKYRVPPTAVREAGLGLAAVPTLTSMGGLLPSYRHSWVPVPSEALKSRVPPTAWP